MANEGCTLDRKKHSKIAIEIRDVTKGGIPCAFGNRDTEHCYLDFLQNNKLLGQEPEASIRYGAGYTLRETYYFFKGCRSFDGIRIDGAEPVILEAEIGDYKDIAETRYHAIMKQLNGHARIVRAICLETLTPVEGAKQFHIYIRQGLDALAKALHDTRGIIDMGFDIA